MAGASIDFQWPIHMTSQLFCPFHQTESVSADNLPLWGYCIDNLYLFDRYAYRRLESQQVKVQTYTDNQLSHQPWTVKQRMQWDHCSFYRSLGYRSRLFIGRSPVFAVFGKEDLLF